MSLILDALRKMEQERRSRRGSGQDLRPEVLRYRLATQPKQSSRYPLVVVAVALLAAGLGGGFLLKGNREEGQGKPDAAATATAPVATPTPVETPAVPPSALAPSAPAALPREPATEPAVAEPARPNPSRPAEAHSRKAPAAAAAQPFPPSGDAAPPQAATEIAISGIAYQDDRRMRRAVLNGVLVGEGAEIAGARVVEIKENRVKLSRGGQTFEVPFSSGAQYR